MWELGLDLISLIFALVEHLKIRTICCFHWPKLIINRINNKSWKSKINWKFLNIKREI